MNKLFKKLFVLLLALTVAFAAVGCDACNEDPGDGGTNAPNTSILQPEAPEITMMSQKTLVVGDDFYLSPKTKNIDGDIIWTSSDDSVATVVNGVVSAINEGTTTITASYNGVTASTEITVGYGNFIPNISTYSGIDVEDTAKTVLAIGNSFNIGAYVDFNNKVFSDATFTYESSDKNALTIDEQGVVTPIKYCENVAITVNATWRKIFTVSKTFNVDVRENVLFYVDDEILQNLVIETPASFYTSEQMTNVVNLTPSVKVGAEGTEDTNVTVAIVPMGDTTAEEYSYNTETKVYTALALGKTMVNFSYTFEGKIYNANFTIEAVRPVKEIATPVDFYSAGAGTYKEKVGDSYVNKTLVDYAWGEGENADITLYDAYQEGETLKVNGEIVENVLVDFDEYTDTAVTIGTKTECYTIHLNDACSYYISDANDLIDALDKTNRTYSSTGLYVLMNDIDMADADPIKNATKIGFHGVFDGKGYTIYNPVVDLTNQANKGFFGSIQSGSTVRDVAFININSVGHQPNVGWLTSQYDKNAQKGITFRNIYIDVNEDMEHRGGMFVLITASVTNFVLVQNNADNFDESEWISTANGYFGNSLLARDSGDYTAKTNSLNNVYVISRKALQYSYEDSKLSEPTYNSDYTINKYGSTMTYAENETELRYVYDYFTNSPSIGGLGLKNPTVQSVINAMGGNGKISVAPNVRLYDSYSAMSVDTDQKHLDNLTEFKASPYWVIVNGAPVWKGVYDNLELHDKHFGITLGNQAVNLNVSAKNYSEYELSLNAFNSELVKDLTFTTEVNEYFEIKAEEIKDAEENVIGKVYKLVTKNVSGGATVPVVASFKYNGVDYTKTINVEVVNPFGFTINEVISQDGCDIYVDEEHQFAISFNGTAVENVTFASSDATVLALKADTTDTFTALKGGTATITATFTYNEINETKQITVNVVDPIELYSYVQIGVETVDEEISLDVYKEYIVDVVCNDTVYEANKLALTSSNTEIVSVEGNVIKILKYFEGASATISVTLTEKGRTYSYSFVVNVYDSVLDKSVVTVGGEELEESSINIEISSSAVIGVKYNGVAVESVTLTGNSEFATIAGTTLTAVKAGQFDLTVTFVIDGNSHVLPLSVSCIYPNVTIDSAVDYDASTGKLLTTATFEGNIYAVSSGEQYLTEGNGLTIVGSNLTIRAQTSNTDTLAGVPYKYNRANTSQVFELKVYTTVNTYVFTNVTYWTKIIYNEGDLREAMGYDVDYTLMTNSNGTIVNSDRVDTPRTLVVDSKLANYYYEGVFNVGLYKLANDVDMEEAGIDYEHPLATGTPNSGGFAALLDGKGYSIKNFKPDANGLVGVMNSYTHQHQLDGKTRSIPCYPTVRNIAFENVITSQAIPIIARTAGYPDEYEGYAPRIENIYVTVSSQSTGSAGIINTVNSHVTTNNVYIVDNNEYASQFIDDGMYKFTDRNGAVTIPEGKVYNPLAAAKNNSLFGKIGDASANSIKNSVARTTNVYVVSKLPLMYHNSTTNYIHYYLIVVNKTEKTIGLSLGYLGGAAPSYVRAYGYGANETVGFIPAIYAVRGNVSKAFTDYYEAANLATKETHSYAGLYCDKCYETTFTFATTSKAGESCCFDTECGGKLVKVAATNGFFNSPIAYEWTLHNLETEAGTDYKTTNGTFRFPGAYRYDDVESLKAVAYDYSSFTGDAGNGLWEVVETDDGEGNTLRELKWVGAKA